MGGCGSRDLREEWPGSPYPQGATYDGTGTNFSLFSGEAERVDLCLFDDQGRETFVELPEVTVHCWHGYLPEVGPGQRYGYRVYGRFAPHQGRRFNAAKLLIDPYAKAIDGDVIWDEAVYGYRFADPGADLGRNDLDGAPFVPKSVVVDPAFDWGDDRRPGTPLDRTVIYEAHVKGLTELHPTLPARHRGTYAALCAPSVIEHLGLLGVTALELLPVHHFVHDQVLVDRGLRNHWGYNSIGFFAPHHAYSSSGGRGQQVREFKEMVRALHQAGIEVILDVVYNHTAEGNHLGPTLSFRGIDNAAFYRLVDADPRHYMDYSGTGNSLNMHVDGFRFDLAATLARELHDVDRLAAFFDLIQQDPVVSQVKLIAEPWDVGEGGYQIGNFPVLWSEWNGKYRDTMRDFWRGEARGVGEFAYRFTGSSDLYQHDGRRPYASINFITCHDGFTLHDLVSYNEKHNDSNGEDSHDGETDNRSWNCGVEGPTDDPEVLALRERQTRNFLATLLLSQGVPMLLYGDEMERTQWGNNNAYCHDDDISWFEWDRRDQNLALLGFTRRLVDLRERHPVFRRRNWFQDRDIRHRGVNDISWLDPSGEEMTDEQWGHGHVKSLGVFLNGDGLHAPGPRGERITDRSFLVLFNAHWEDVPFTLPPKEWGRQWEVVFDTYLPDLAEGSCSWSAADRLIVRPRSLVLLRNADRPG